QQADKAVQDLLNEINGGPFTTPERERQKLLEEARNWNKTSPGWKWRTNECGEQADALRKHLENVLELQFYNMIRVERFDELLVWRVHHNTIQLTPTDMNPDKTVYYIDPFKGGLPWQERNSTGVVKLGTLDELKESYPFTV